MKLDKEKISPRVAAAIGAPKPKVATAPPQKALRFEWKTGTQLSLTNSQNWTTDLGSDRQDSLSIGVRALRGRKEKGLACLSLKEPQTSLLLSQCSENSLSKRDSDCFFKSQKKEIRPKSRERACDFRNGVRTAVQGKATRFFGSEEAPEGVKSSSCSRESRVSTLKRPLDLVSFIEGRAPECKRSLGAQTKKVFQVREDHFFGSDFRALEGKGGPPSERAEPGLESPRESAQAAEIPEEVQPLPENLPAGKRKIAQMRNRKNLKIKVFAKRNEAKGEMGSEMLVESNLKSSQRSKFGVSPMLKTMEHFLGGRRGNFFKGLNRAQMPFATGPAPPRAQPPKPETPPRTTSEKTPKKKRSKIWFEIKITQKNPSANKKQLEILESLRREFSKEDFRVLVLGAAGPDPRRAPAPPARDFASLYSFLNESSSARVLEHLGFFQNYSLVLHNCYFSTLEIAHRMHQCHRALSPLRDFLLRKLRSPLSRPQKVNEVVFKLFLLHLRVPRGLLGLLGPLQKGCLVANLFFKMFERTRVAPLLLERAARDSHRLQTFFSSELRLQFAPEVLAEMYLLVQLAAQLNRNFGALCSRRHSGNPEPFIAAKLNVDSVWGQLEAPSLPFADLMDSLDLEAFQQLFIFVKHTHFGPKQLFLTNGQKSQSKFKVFFLPSDTREAEPGPECGALVTRLGGRRVEGLPHFWRLSKKTMGLGGFRKTRKPAELYKKIQRSLSKLIGTRLNAEANASTLARPNGRGPRAAQKVKRLLRLSEAELFALNSERRVKGTMEGGMDSERVNAWVRRMLRQNSFNPALLSAIKCTPLFGLYGEWALGEALVERQVASILEVDFFKKSCLQSFEPKEALSTAKPGFVWPWAVLEFLSLVKMHQSFPRELNLGKMGAVAK